MFKEKITCGLDLGVKNIKLSAIKCKEENVYELLGVCEQPIFGYANGIVNELNEFSECIHQAIDGLSKKCQIKIKDIHLGINGKLIETRHVVTQVPLLDSGSKIVTKRDIKKVNHQARLLGVKMEEEVIHDLPQYYVIDETQQAINPLGLYGRKLGVHSLMAVIPSNPMRNLVKAVQQAGYEVVNIALSSYAAADVILSDQQKKTGVLFLDFGVDVTVVLLYKDNSVKYLKKIDMGGYKCTDAISKALSLPFDVAEEIKKSYANVLAVDSHNEDEILVKRESTYVPIRTKDVCDAIKPKINIFLGELNNMIDEDGLLSQINTGMIMTGGGALLAGLMERMMQEFKLPIQLGSVSNISLKNFGNSAIFSSSIGLAYQGLLKQKTQRSLRKEVHWTKLFANRVNEMYHEYF